MAYANVLKELKEKMVFVELAHRDNFTTLNLKFVEIVQITV
jgi:hypothetical protein